MADAALPAPEPLFDPALERVFALEIRPRIPALEDRRHALAGRLWIACAVIALCASVVAAWLGSRYGPAVVPFVLAAAGTFGGFLYVRLLRAWNTALLGAVMPPLAAHLDETRHAPAAASDLLVVAVALGIVAPARHSHLSHRIEGRRRGIRFVATHATLARSRVWRDAAFAFHGLLVRLEVPVAPPGEILILPSGHPLPPATAVAGNGQPPFRGPIAFADPSFETRFAVYGRSAEPEAVRAYLVPHVRAALLALDAAEGSTGHGAALRAAVVRSGFYIALPRMDWVGAGGFGLFRPRPFLDGGGILSLYDIEPTVRRIAQDLATPHRIVDRLVS